MMKLSKYEQETIINFNAGERNATLYTRDRKVMREMDELVSKYPDIYHLDSQTDLDKTYSFSKSALSIVSRELCPRLRRNGKGSG